MGALSTSKHVESLPSFPKIDNIFPLTPGKKVIDPLHYKCKQPNSLNEQVKQGLETTLEPSSWEKVKENFKAEQEKSFPEISFGVDWKLPSRSGVEK
jgi:hypothetical protein